MDQPTSDEDEPSPRRRDARRPGSSSALIVIARGDRAWRSGATLQMPTQLDGQRHLALVHRLEPARARHLRHRRVPLAGEDAGQGQEARQARPARRRGGPAPEDRVRARAEAWKAGEPSSTSIRASRRSCPTLIAGVLYPVRRATGVPLDQVVEQERLPRNVQKDVDGPAGQDRVRPGDAQGAGEVAGLRLLLQADRSCCSTSCRCSSSWSSTPGCSTATRRTTGPGSSACSPRRWGRTCSSSTRR